MKEVLESNVITKYLAGFSTPKEVKEVETWFKKNPNNALFANMINQQVQVMLNQIGKSK